MVKVAKTATNKIVAWRVRDAMARHPSLSNARSCIVIHTAEDHSGSNSIQLEGWTLDERMGQLALTLAMRAAGCHSVQSHLQTLHTQKSANEKHTLLLSCGNEAPTVN